MKKIITLALAATLAFAPALGLTACGGWEKLTSGGIAIESVEFTEEGYIVEDAVKEAALRHAEITDAECLSFEMVLDESKDPVRYVADFSSIEGTNYHYVIDAKTGDLIDFTSFQL